MKRVRIVAAVFLAMLSLFAFAQVAFAGEWAPGLNDFNGASGVARSECVFNGQDDPDPEDDFIWGMSPAGGRVQSGGQLVALGKQMGVELVPSGIQGQACNGHLNPINR